VRQRQQHEDVARAAGERLERFADARIAQRRVALQFL
jgi:hypothetical protein